MGRSGGNCGRHDVGEGSDQLCAYENCLEVQKAFRSLVWAHTSEALGFRAVSHASVLQCHPKVPCEAVARLGLKTAAF